MFKFTSIEKSSLDKFGLVGESLVLSKTPYTNQNRPKLYIIII